MYMTPDEQEAVELEMDEVVWGETCNILQALYLYFKRVAF
jgi:hypothetical protein